MTARAQWTVQVCTFERTFVSAYSSYRRAREALSAAEASRLAGVQDVCNYQLFDADSRCVHDFIDDGPADDRVWQWCHLRPGVYAWDSATETMQPAV